MYYKTKLRLKVTMNVDAINTQQLWFHAQSFVLQLKANKLKILLSHYPNVILQSTNTNICPALIIASTNPRTKVRELSYFQNGH
jgi:hypothetical protein